jgi:hypothetical protein
MPKLSYDEAIKKAKTLPKTDNYMVVQIQSRVVVPYKEGLQIMSGLQNAEKINPYWSSEPPWAPVDSGTITYEIMAPEVYHRHRVAALMGVSLKELEEAEKASQQEPA